MEDLTHDCISLACPSLTSEKVLPLRQELDQCCPLYSQSPSAISKWTSSMSSVISQFLTQDSNCLVIYFRSLLSISSLCYTDLCFSPLPWHTVSIVYHQSRNRKMRKTRSSWALEGSSGKDIPEKIPTLQKPLSSMHTQTHTTSQRNF